MNRYPDVCLQSLCRFGSLGSSKTTLKELKQRRFVSFQTIPCSYDYDYTLLFKGPLLGLRQCLTTGNPLKMMKNVFYFILKSLLVLEIFIYLS